MAKPRSRKKRKKAGDEAREFFIELAKSDPAPVYLLHGSEAFLLDMALERVEALVLPAGRNDFNYDVFYGREVDGEKVAMACETLALFGGRRLVVIKEVAYVAAAQQAVIADYLSSPSPMTTLVLHGNTGEKSLPRNSKVLAAARKVGVVQEFRALREWEVGTFLGKQAKARGLVLDTEAQDTLIKSVGSDLSSLDAALEKLDLYMGASDGPRAVGEDDLTAVVAATRSHDIFELTEAIASRDLGRSLHLLHKMLDQGQSAVSINHMIARQMRQVWQVKLASEEGGDKFAIARAAGCSPYFVPKFQKYARKFADNELRRCLRASLTTDTQLKSSRLSDQVVLESLVVGICT